VKQDIALYQERKKEKTVSLNYAKRQAELKKDEDRRTARNKVRAARPVPPLSITDITLQDIEAGKPLVLNSTAAMVVDYSTAAKSAAAAGLAVSTAAASAAVKLSSAAFSGVAVSSSAVQGAGYARAPAAGDFVLEEAARVLADMLAPRPAAAVRNENKSSSLAAAGK